MPDLFEFESMDDFSKSFRWSELCSMKQTVPRIEI